MNLNMLREPSLEYLAKQGVLLLNSMLTAREGVADAHKELWKPFIEFFFKEVMAGISGIPVVFFGKVAQEYEPLVNLKMNYTKCVEHPSFANRENRPFRHNKLFRWTNQILKDNNNLKIEWIEEPPF